MLKRCLTAAVISTFVLALPAAAATGPVLDVTADTHVEEFGHTVDSFTVTLAEDFDASGLDLDHFIVENDVVHPYIPEYADGVTKVTTHNGLMTIDVDPFLFGQGFIVSCVKDGEVLFSFTRDDVSSFSTAVVDEFSIEKTDQAVYRIFRPETEEDVPLIIWFHGAGERGDDGYKPLIDYRGAVCWAEPSYQAKHPCAVLVPQIPAGTDFNKEQLDDIRKMADKMIAEGGIDASRIYVVGFSAYQASLWFATYNVDFVAAVLHCLYWHAFDPDPRVGDEWGGVGWDVIAEAQLPLWSCISSADPTGATEEMQTYHIPYQEEHNPNFKYSIWSQAEMYEYQLFGFLMHHGWIPAINNQEIIDWLFAQSRS